jgi:hypothetical protein
MAVLEAQEERLGSGLTKLLVPQGPLVSRLVLLTAPAWGRTHLRPEVVEVEVAEEAALCPRPVEGELAVLVLLAGLAVPS